MISLKQNENRLQRKRSMNLRPLIESIQNHSKNKEWMISLTLILKKNSHYKNSSEEFDLTPPCCLDTNNYFALRMKNKSINSPDIKGQYSNILKSWNIQE